MLQVVASRQTFLLIFFIQKVVKIRGLINSARVLLFGDPLDDDSPYVGNPWTSISPVTIFEVSKSIASMSGKTSPLDLIPTNILKACSDVFSPIIMELANRSFVQGCFPSCFKVAQVKPILKKPGMDEDVLASYRPISNLSTVSKIVERLFLARLKSHVAGSKNFNAKQSGFRSNHSTETAIQSILNDIFRSADNGELSILVALDISAAFDTIDHGTLLRRLGHTFGMHGVTLNWISSYLSDRYQYVKIGDVCSDKLSSEFGVPQGSVLGPMLFVLFISPVAQVVEKFGLRHHQYADDTQIYVSFKPTDSLQCLSVIERTTHAVRNWFYNEWIAFKPSQDRSHVSWYIEEFVESEGSNSYKYIWLGYQTIRTRQKPWGNYRCQDKFRSTRQ